jgi:hypothetical protein
MAEADRTPRPLPVGLLESLTATSAQEIRVDEVARGRRSVASRAYEDGAVVEEIASQLLTLSAAAAR